MFLVKEIFLVVKKISSPPQKSGMWTHGTTALQANVDPTPI
jgi:hypothetical protein